MSHAGSKVFATRQGLAQGLGDETLLLANAGVHRPSEPSHQTDDECGSCEEEHSVRLVVVHHSICPRREKQEIRLPTAAEIIGRRRAERTRTLPSSFGTQRLEKTLLNEAVGLRVGRALA